MSTAYDEGKHRRDSSGKFVTKPATESSTALRAPQQQWVPQADSQAIDSLAVMLAEQGEGGGSGADVLEATADLIGATGRPHPGDGDPDTYLQDMVDWAQQKPGRGTDMEDSTHDTRALNQLALDLGEADDWSGGDAVESVVLCVTRTGRPNPDRFDDGTEEYADELRAWRLQTGHARDLERLEAGEPAELTYVAIERGHNQDMVLVYEDSDEAEAAIVGSPMVDGVCEEDCLDLQILDSLGADDLESSEVVLAPRDW